MPRSRLKVTETRKTPEDVVIMSWSPKMDLLALASKSGDLYIHRLSGTKRVWELSLSVEDEAVTPELIVWHPEGLFLVVISGTTTFVIDVESGKVVHNLETQGRITAARWCTSQYQHATSDNQKHEPKSKPKSEVTSPPFHPHSSSSSHSRQTLVQRMEANLSILFLGTENGSVYGYTGGFLLGLCIEVAEELGGARILQIDATQDLQSFYFLLENNTAASSGPSSSRRDSTPPEVSIMFSHLTNQMLPKMAHLVRPLGLRYILFLKSWATVQTEFANLNESWGKMIDVYQTYMTLGDTKDLEVARVDYLELALTGICSVEVEIFLGSAGREKEARKNVNTINSCSSNISEHIRTVKCSLANMLTELNEIGGFLKEISKSQQAEELLIEMRKSIMYFFLAVLNMQGILRNFVDMSLHFMSLIMNTIHSFNIQDLPDFIEEDIDTDKVIQFVQTKVDKDIFEYLFSSVRLGYSEDNKRKKRGFTTTVPLSNNVFTSIMNPEGGINNYEDFPNLIHNILKKSSSYKEGGHPFLLDYSEDEVKELVMNIVPTINSLMKRLLSIPVLCSVPFTSDTFPIIRIPTKRFFSDESTKIRKLFNLCVHEANANVYLSTLLEPTRLLLFSINFSEKATPMLKSSIILFSQNMYSLDVYSEDYLTVICHEERDNSTSGTDNQQRTGRTLVCQLPHASLVNVAKPISIHALLEAKCSAKSIPPQRIRIQIPKAPVKSSSPPPPTSPYIECILPIDDFAAKVVKVSGPRKVGSVLGDDGRTIIIMEMEMDAEEEESTMDENGDDEEEEGTGSGQQSDK